MIRALRLSTFVGLVSVGVLIGCQSAPEGKDQGLDPAPTDDGAVADDLAQTPDAATAPDLASSNDGAPDLSTPSDAAMPVPPSGGVALTAACLPGVSGPLALRTLAPSFAVAGEPYLGFVVPLLCPGGPAVVFLADAPQGMVLDTQNGVGRITWTPSVDAAGANLTFTVGAWTAASGAVTSTLSIPLLAITPTASGIIGTGGGAVTEPMAPAAHVDIPASVLSADTTVTLARVQGTLPPPPGATIVGTPLVVGPSTTALSAAPAYDLEYAADETQWNPDFQAYVVASYGPLDSLTADQQAQAFAAWQAARTAASGATLTLPFAGTPPAGAHRAVLVWHLDPSSPHLGAWSVATNATFDVVQGTATIPLRHFSIYVAAWILDPSLTPTMSLLGRTAGGKPDVQYCDEAKAKMDALDGILSAFLALGSVVETWWDYASSAFKVCTYPAASTLACGCHESAQYTQSMLAAFTQYYEIMLVDSRSVSGGRTSGMAHWMVVVRPKPDADGQRRGDWYLLDRYMTGPHFWTIQWMEDKYTLASDPMCQMNQNLPGCLTPPETNVLESTFYPSRYDISVGAELTATEIGRHKGALNVICLEDPDKPNPVPLCLGDYSSTKWCKFTLHTGKHYNGSARLLPDSEDNLCYTEDTPLRPTGNGGICPYQTGEVSPVAGCHTGDKSMCFYGGSDPGVPKSDTVCPGGMQTDCNAAGSPGCTGCIQPECCDPGVGCVVCVDKGGCGDCYPNTDPGYVPPTCADPTTNQYCINEGATCQMCANCPVPVPTCSYAGGWCECAPSTKWGYNDLNWTVYF